MANQPQKDTAGTTSATEIPEKYDFAGFRIKKRSGKETGFYTDDSVGKMLKDPHVKLVKCRKIKCLIHGKKWYLETETLKRTIQQRPSYVVVTDGTNYTARVMRHP